MRLGILVVILACTISLLVNNAEAAKPNIKAVGIWIERSCQMSEKCVQYSDIKYLDNSPRSIGELVTKNGITKRISTPIQNNVEWLRYSQMDFTVIDPPGNFNSRIKSITIVSNLDQFIQPSQYKVTELSTNPEIKPTSSVRYYSHGWKVDSSCYTASVDGTQWKTLLEPMIKYLQSNCTTEMPYSNIKADIKPLTKQDLSSSYKAKDQKWRDYIKENCIKSRNACTTLEQPTRAGLKP